MIHSLKRHITALALYTGLTLVMTAPVIANLATHVAGQGGDPWQTMWRFENEWRNFDWIRLFGGGEPRLINLSVWPWMPLHVAFGEPVAYNVVFLLSFILSGYFMYLLVKYLTGREAAAFLAGALYMFLPFHVAHGLGHFGALQTQWLPLAILLLFRWVQRPTFWKTIGLALVVTWQSWSEHHYLFWLGIFGIVFLIFQKFTGFATPERPATRTPYLALLAFLIIIFALLPWLPTVRLGFQPDNDLSLGVEQTIRFSADLFAFVTPPAWQPVWGGVAYELFGQHFTGNIVEANQFLGFLSLVLLLFFHQHIPRRQKKFWLLIAAVFFIMSLGPKLHVFGNVLPVLLPYALVDSLPVFSAVRAVARAGVMVGLAISVLFGWVLARELTRPISAAIVLAVILTEFLFLPVPLQETKLSRAYEIIKQLPGKSLIEIPAVTNYTVASQSLYASHIHNKEVYANIALERASGSREISEARSLPGLRQLLFLRTKSLLEQEKDSVFGQDLGEALREALHRLDARAIAVHVDSLSAEQRRAVEYFLEKRVGWPGEKYDDIVLYKVP